MLGRRSACVMADLQSAGRCLPPPLQNHTCRNRSVCEPGALGQSGSGVWVLGASVLEIECGQ